MKNDVKLFIHSGDLYFCIEQISMAFEAWTFPKAFQYPQTMKGLVLFDNAG